MKISENQLRQLVREALDNPAYLSDNLQESQVIQPVMSSDPVRSVELDPWGKQYHPTSKMEFILGVKDITKHVPDNLLSQVFKVVRDAVLNFNPEKQKEERVTIGPQPRTKNEQRFISSVLKEIDELAPRDRNLPVRVSAQPNPLASDEDAVDPNDSAALEQIAKELGFNNRSAVRHVVNRTLEKMRYLVDTDEEFLNKVVDKAIQDYINHLQSSGELSYADVQLMTDHPEMVKKLDGFRCFLRNYVNGMMRGDVEL